MRKRDKQKMANEEQLAILKQGVDVWNQWREEYPDEEIDLTDADFFEVDFSGINLSKANLNSADFEHATIVSANLKKTTLWRANFFATNLAQANFSQALLNYTDFDGANLSGATFKLAEFKHTILRFSNCAGANFSLAFLDDTDFKGCILESADFTNAKLDYCLFAQNDLSKIIGLKTVKHYSFSPISTDTIQQSNGKIPIEFLLGCGLSDIDIAYAKLAAPGLDPEEVSQILYEIHNMYLDQPIQFHSVFISYSSKDEEFAQRLHDDLQDSGVRCWFAPEDLKIGARIRPTIDHQIRMREKLIVIISENAMQSEWVGDEVEAALEQERVSSKDLLFPLRLDEAVLNSRDDWAAKLKRRRNIGDFSKWKDDAAYQKMFKRLLRDLRASQE